MIQPQSVGVVAPQRAHFTEPLALRSGGVGYYPRDNFLHIDTGRFRIW